MSKLIPFNRNNELMPSGFRSFSGMLDDFFSDEFPTRRSLIADIFKVDVREDESHYFVEAELPGVKKEDIHVALSEGCLKVSVAHEEKTEEKKQNYLHQERRFESMERNILLKDAKEDGIRAVLKDGILEVAIPKKKSDGSAKRIEIE